MDSILYLYLSLLVALLAILYALKRYIYHSGLIDGYGASVEPDNPDYRDARLWLQKNRAGEWPELIPVRRRAIHERLNAEPVVTDWDVGQQALDRTRIDYRFVSITGEERE